MLNKFAIFWVLSGLAVFSGCATNADLASKVQAKASCCKSMSEFKYEGLAFKAPPLSFALNEQSPLFEFETGKSYFKAFSLPRINQPAKLRVWSRPTGSIGFETQTYSQAFCATARFLDANYQTISAKNDVPIFVRGFWASSFLSEFDVPIEAKYLVLHTDPTHFFMNALRDTSGGAYLVGNTVVIESGSGAILHPCGPIADAQVELL